MDGDIGGFGEQMLPVQVALPVRRGWEGCGRRGRRRGAVKVRRETGLRSRDLSEDMIREPLRRTRI